MSLLIRAMCEHELFFERFDHLNGSASAAALHLRRSSAASGSFGSSGENPKLCQTFSTAWSGVKLTVQLAKPFRLILN